jgi:hypothetical protein
MLNTIVSKLSAAVRVVTSFIQGTPWVAAAAAALVLLALALW